MKKQIVIVFIISLFISAQSWALNLVDFKQSADEKLYDDRSCNDLYMEASALEKQTFSYAEDKSNKTLMASVASTVFTPALYLVGYSAIKDYKNEADAKSTFVKMEELRYRMAEKRCFEK